jgi:hypothetical protein
LGGEGVVTTITNGTPGTAQLVPGTNLLWGVSCSSVTTCYAVGTNSAQTEGVVVTTTNGTPGTAQVVPGALLYGVACPSATSCVAVGYNASGQGVVTTITNGTPGTAQVVSGTDAATQLEGVACSSATRCVAVGADNPTVGAADVGVVVPITNGIPGTAQVVSGTYWLIDVACPSATRCVAVAENGNASGSGLGGEGVVTTITNGTPGTAQLVPGALQLAGVASSSATTCYAVGINSNDNEGVVVPITNGTPGSPQQVGSTP